jgi:ribosomal protein S8
LKHLNTLVIRLNGAIRSNKDCVEIFKTKLIINILDVLAREGFIQNYVNITNKTVIVYFRKDDDRPPIRFSVLTGTRYHSITNKELQKSGGKHFIISTTHGIFSSLELNYLGFKFGGRLLLEIQKF